MRPFRFLLIALAAVAALALVACSGDEAATVTPTETPTATATSSDTPTAEPTPTVEPVSGIPEVDQVIAGVAAQDLDALLALIAWQEAPCVTAPEGLGGPPRCDVGQAEGTVVRVFPIAACEGEFVRDPGGDLFEFIEQVEALHSVVEAPDYERAEPYWPVGDYYVNFRADVFGEAVGTRLVIEDGKIVMIFFGCNHPPELLLEDGGTPLPVIYRAPDA